MTTISRTAWLILILGLLPWMGATSPPALPAAPPAPPAPLDEVIDELLRSSRATPAFWGLYVQDLESGRVLFERNGEKSFLPASNQKLLTTATALGALGSTYRYETTLAFDGTVQDSVMTGDLVIEGSGDPTFGSREIRGEDPLQTWATKLALMGVRRIEGRLIGNDDAFDDQAYSEGWDIDYLTRQAGRYIGTSTGGLAYHDNVVTLQIRANAPGLPPTVTTRPENVVTIRNEATTSSRRRGGGLAVRRSFRSNEIVVEGTTSRYYNGSVVVPVNNPTLLTLEAFREALRDVGIATDLTLADIDDLDTKPPGDAPPLFIALSPPLSDIVSILNKDSNNFYAEQVFRTYGWAGSARGGARRTKTFLSRAGIDTRSLLIRDGSGLSRKDLVTPKAMVELLALMDHHPEREAFMASLPLGGESNTTLQYRLRNIPVRAKTGSLRFVRALSGYATRPDGNRVAFAFFANNYTGPSYRITNLFDQIVTTITSSPAS